MKTRILYFIVLILLSKFSFSQDSEKIVSAALDSVYQSRDWIIYNRTADEKSGIKRYYVQQTFKGIPVFNAITIVVTKNDKIELFKSGFVDKIKSKIKATEPAISAHASIDFALRHLEIKTNETFALIRQDEISKKYYFEGGNLTNTPVTVELVYLPKDEKVHLAWNVSLDLKKQSHWWNVRVNAVSGEYLNKNDYVAHCEFSSDEESNGNNPNNQSSNLLVSSAGYRVFPFPVEAPSFGPRSLLLNPASPAASPFGWHDENGIPGDEFTITRGNNVYAYEDADNDNLPGYSPDGGPALNFDYPLDFNLPPMDNKDASLTNLFYATNRIHDFMYAHGFNESDGNFQANNYGNGGLGNDAILAEGFDGSGTDNANFATPPDGYNPRMQMYLWAGPVCGSLTVNSPGGIAGVLSMGGAEFNIVPSNVSGDLILVDDGTALPTEGCFPTVNTIAGKIAVIDRGSCLFVEKVIHAQNAGAIGVIIVNYLDEVFYMSGIDPAITIPSVMIKLSDGNILKNEMLVNTVNVTIDLCTPTQLDVSFDNGVTAHEFGHGLSNRLTAGPSNVNCLWNGETGSEGWSDWLALVMTIEPGDQGTDPRGVGTYVANEGINDNGIRTFPYSTDMSINPHTYADITFFGEVHYVGEVWCSAIWDLTWALINQSGYSNDPANPTAGNNIAIRLILEGLRIQPCGPGFLDSRDAILEADRILYNNAHRCLIWQIFARRGMGFYAYGGSPDFTGDEFEDFSLPPGVQPHITGAGAFCKPMDAVLDAGAGWNSYLWSTGQTSQTIIPSTFGMYSVTVTGLGCSFLLESGSTSAEIIPTFSPTITTTPPFVCPDGTSQLAASNDIQIGTSTTKTSSTSFPAPYGNYWTSGHEQYLVLASELISSGLLPGNITSMAFDIVYNYAYGGTRNFNISLASTAATDLTTTFINTGFTNVYTNADYISVPGWNVHNFSTPFLWDGVSNIVVDVSMINCATCPGLPCVDYTLNNVIHVTPTSFESCTYTYDDYNCTVPSFTPTSAVYTIKLRPNMKFIGNTPPATYSWSPSTYLSSTSISNPVANNIMNDIYYTATVTKSNGCYGFASQGIDVLSAPPAPYAIFGAAKVCKGQTAVTYCIDEIPGATEYEWILPNGMSGNSTSNCITIDFSNTFNGGLLCVKSKNSCFSSTATCFNIKIQNSKPHKPDAIIGNPSVCLPSVNFYCIPAVPEADEYIWTITGNGGSFPMTIVDGQGTACVYVDQPVGYNGNQKLTVRASNCKGLSDDRKLDIKVLNIPNRPGNINGPASVCKSQTKNYSVGNMPNVTSFYWTLTGGGVIQAGQGTRNITVKFGNASSTSATLSVIAENACGASIARSKTIFVNLSCKEGETNSNESVLTDQPLLTVYPNPVTDKLGINFTTVTEGKYNTCLYDITGRKINSEDKFFTEGENQFSIDVKNLSSGIYLLIIRKGDMMVYQKVVKD